MSHAVYVGGLTLQRSSNAKFRFKFNNMNITQHYLKLALSLTIFVVAIIR